MKTKRTGKKLLTLVTFLFISYSIANSQVQLMKWVFTPKQIDFTVSPPTASNLTGAPATTGNVANSFYDSNGSLLFYCSNGNIYKADGTLIGGTSSNTPTANELTIVPFPGNGAPLPNHNIDYCINKYY